METLTKTINKTLESATAFLQSDIIKNVENLQKAYNDLNVNGDTNSNTTGNDNNVNNILRDDFKVTERPQFIDFEEDIVKKQYIDAYDNDFDANNDNNSNDTSLSAIHTILSFTSS